MSIKETGSPDSLDWALERKSIYMNSILLEEMVKNHLNLDFVPVLSEPSLECQWSGRTGNVHEAVMKDDPNLLGYEVYASAHPSW
jgi:CDP-4-dehydro-6-deoxyglucose reductase